MLDTSLVKFLLGTEIKKNSPAYNCAQGTWAGQSCLLLSSLPSLPLSSLPYHLLLLLISTFNSSFTQEIFSECLLRARYYSSTRILQNETTSLHSNAVHLKLQCHLNHLGSCQNGRTGLRGCGAGPSTCIANVLPGDADTASSHPLCKVLD